MKHFWKSAQNGESIYWRTRCADAVGVIFEMGEHLDLAWQLNSIIKEEPTRILDLGVGPMGVGLLWLYPSVPVRVGLDSLSRMPVATGNIYADSLVRTIQEETIYIQGKGEGLPFKSESFDLAICNNVLDHAFSPTEMLYELCRVTKKNGYLGIGVDTNSILGFFIRRIDRRIRSHLNTYKVHPHDILIGKIDNFLNNNNCTILYNNTASKLGRIIGRRRIQFWVAQKI